MKLRVGFVSNSSTSSFLIYGIVTERYEVEEILRKKGLMPDNVGDEDHEDYIDTYEWFMEDDGSNFFQKSGLDIDLVYEDSIWVGRCCSSVGDDETGKQFRDGIKENIVKLLGEEMAEGCDNHEGAYYS